MNYESWQAQGGRTLEQFGNQIGQPTGQGTIARLNLAGRDFYGINAHGQSISLRVNPISRTHAEADAFNQASNAGVTARSATLYTNRPLCGACGQRGAVKSMAGQLGIRELTIVSPTSTQLIIID